MVDLLFVELGAVVTEVLGPSRCTVELYCSVKAPPTYGAGDRVEFDFARSLENCLNADEQTPVGVAAQQALYDQYEQIKGHGSPLIGPDWPGASYEGIVSIRDHVVKTNAAFSAAAAALPGHPWEYQVVTSIDEATGEIRRYHGFHAEVVPNHGKPLELLVCHAGRSADPTSPRRKIPYDPTNTARFYTGELVAGEIVKGGPAPRSSGAVFINLEAAATSGVETPKLPPSAGN